MAGTGDSIHWQVVEIMYIVAYGLHRIGVIESAMLPTKVPNRFDIVDITDLVVGMHDRDQGFWMLFQKFLQMRQIDSTLLIHLHTGQTALSLLSTCFQRVQHSLVLERSSDGMLSVMAYSPAGEGCLISFSSSSGEKYLPRIRVQQCCKVLSGFVYGRPYLPTL